eukprot:scaffold136201_cov54-Attheya_sp.AAC.4
MESVVDVTKEDVSKEEEDIDEIMRACAEGKVEEVRRIVELDASRACRQNQKTGKSPLMMAAEMGHLDIVTMLLEAGAPWNAIDRFGQCAGNYATDAGHQSIVDLLVNAGTQAELILGASIRLGLVVRNTEKAAISTTTAAAPESESKTSTTTVPVEHEPCTKPDYLDRNVRYNADQTALLDEDDDAVMMEWERPLMEAHASILTSNEGGKRVLNVGFGMGIIDTALQKRQPSLHIIIEAHPQVYAKMLHDKWDQKPNVRICFGKWQTVLPQLIQEGVILDGIFYDTYGEHFTDLEDFHDGMVQLLAKPHGIYSFFNGLAPDNIFFHGVACQCVKLQLAQHGLETEFAACHIEVKESDWDGVRRKYWHNRDTYYLPIATWSSTTEKQDVDHEAEESSTNKNAAPVEASSSATSGETEVDNDPDRKKLKAHDTR